MIKNLKNKKIIKIFCETPGTFGAPKVNTTGNFCPVYFDPRVAFSYPEKLMAIAEECVKEIETFGEDFDFILGGATAGISLAAYIAYVMKKRLGYVRKQPKENASNTVEGHLKKGMKVVLIDDAEGQGKAKKLFIDNIRNSGFEINNVIVAVARTARGASGEKANGWVVDKKVNLICLCDCYDMVDYARKNNLLSEEVCNLSEWYCDDAGGWNKDPRKWNYFLEYLKKTNQPLPTLSNQI